VLKRGKALLRSQKSLLDCTIRDQSEGGARLIIEHAIMLPDVFRLMNVSDGETIEVRVVWRQAGQVGVQYISQPEKGLNTRS
jgi:hypothetical protein